MGEPIQAPPPRDTLPGSAEHDPVHRPSHYTRYTPELLDVVEEWMRQGKEITPHEYCALKYIDRWREKGGVEDLRKARNYLDRLVRLQEKL